MNNQISELSVSEKAIMHQWGESYGTLHLLLRSDLPADKAAACLRKARADLNLPRRWGTDLGGLAATPKGPVLILHGLTERREVVDVVRQVAENLRKQGVTGRLMSWGFQASPVDNPLLTLHSVAAGISLRGSESYDPPVPGVPRARIEYHWDIDSAMLTVVLDYALQWCRLPAGTHFVSSGLSQFKCTEEARRELWTAAYGANIAAALTCATGPDNARCVAITNDGFLTFERRLPSGGWDDAVDDLTGVLEAMADYAQYGMIKRTRMPGFAWQTLIEFDWPERPHLYTSAMWGQALMSERVPDAFGVQLLSKTHELPDGDGLWDVRPAGRSSVILTHTDLTAWFDDLLPRQEVLDGGRRSLSHLLMTDAMLREKKADFFGEHLRTPAS